MTMMMMMMMMVMKKMMKIMMCVLACLQLSPIFPFIITGCLAMIYGSIFMLSITSFEPTIGRIIREKKLTKKSHICTERVNLVKSHRVLRVSIDFKGNFF